MKRYMLMAMLVAGLVFAVRVFAQDDDDDQKSFKEEMKDIELQNSEMDLQERQAELDFKQECRKLELQKQQVEIEKQKQMIKQQIPPQGGHVSRPGMPGCALMGGHGNRPCMPPSHCMLGFAVFMLATMIIHILLGVWVYQDLRKRSTGSGIWIVIVLISGLIGGLVYAVVRVGDTRQA